MYNFSHDRITIASILDKRVENKNKKFSIKIRVTYQRERKYYPTGKDLTVAEWEALPGTKSKAASELKASIQVSFEAIKKVTEGLIKDGLFSFELLNIRLGRGMTGSVNTAFKAKIEALKDEERVGTETCYKNTLSNIEKFSGEKISFLSVTTDWLKKYEKWMLAKDLSYSTIGMYMKSLRAILNAAKRDGVISEQSFPFGKDKYSVPIGEGRKLALNLAMIKKVIDYKDEHEVTERYRDLWFLSYLVNGINMNDLLRLKDANFRAGEIRFFRAKTIRTSKKKKELIAVVTPEIMTIIDMWGVPNRKQEDYIFPYLQGVKTASEQKKIVNDVTKRVNKVLKRIGEALKIEDFTTYSARHSFATVLKRSGANIAYISESLGHPDVKTTESYLDSFETEERLKNAVLLTAFKVIEEIEPGKTEETITA